MKWVQIFNSRRIVSASMSVCQVRICHLLTALGSCHGNLSLFRGLVSRLISRVYFNYKLIYGYILKIELGFLSRTFVVLTRQKSLDKS